MANYKYSSDDLKTIDEEVVKSSMEEIMVAYRNLQKVAAETGIGGTTGEQIKANMAELDNVFKTVQSKIEDTDAAVGVKQQQESKARAELDRINQSR